MTYTENYSLNQWEKSDRLQMSDFNAAMSAIDTAIKAAHDSVRVVTGTYTGTGKYGSATNATSITLPFVPKLIAVFPSKATLFLISAYGTGQATTSPNGNSAGSMYMVWNEKTVSWYSAASSVSSAEDQLNKSGTQYIYFAIG